MVSEPVEVHWRKLDERGGSGWLYVNRRQALRLDSGLALKNGMVYGAVDNSWCFCDACEQWDCETSHVDLGHTVVVVLQQRTYSDSRTAKGLGCSVSKTASSISDDSRSVMARLQNSTRYWNKITKIEVHRG